MNYLEYLDNYYNDKTITYIKTELKKEIIILQNKKNVKQIKERILDYWLIRGWSELDAIDKIKEIKLNRKSPVSILNLEYWVNKGLSVEDSKKKISNIQKERQKNGRKNNPDAYYKPISPFTDNFWIAKGITNSSEIQRKIRSQRKLNIEYWLDKGYNNDESGELVSSYQKENCKKKVEKWKDKTDTFDYKKLHNTNIEYYLNKGYSLSESDRLLKDRQTTFTLKKCIIKYGEIIGTEKYNDRQYRWQNSMAKNGNIKSGFSKVSQELFEILQRNYDDNDKEYLFFASKNKEFKLPKSDGGIWLYDFADIKNKKLIEYNGDIYHANPKHFKSDDCPHPYMKTTTAQMIWNKDLKKEIAAKEKGYELLTVWESDFLINREIVINKCKKYLNR
jgi:hypothetical protein